jgi:hypothetical protein
LRRLANGDSDRTSAVAAIKCDLSIAQLVHRNYHEIIEPQTNLESFSIPLRGGGGRAAARERYAVPLFIVSSDS